MPSSADKISTNLSIQDIIIAFLLHAQLDIRSIRRSNIRFRHQERRADMAVQQWLQPLLLLRIISILRQHLHVPRIRSSAINSLRRSSRLAELLCYQSILEVREAGRFFVVALSQEHVP